MDRPQRKHPRLKHYDYSLPGYYYVTIHTQEQGNVLSTVGRGLPPTVRLTSIGKLAEQQLRKLETRFPFVRIDKYCVMPTHIHAIIRFLERPAGASPRPTLTDVVCAYKSITTRLCNSVFHTPGRKLFQASFYEHVIRSRQDYDEIAEYIENNPKQWEMDELYTEY